MTQMPPNMPPSSYLASRLAQANGQLMPQGEPVAAFSRREEAFAAFDVLAAANYPITALYLVNEGLKPGRIPHPAGVRPSASGRSYPGVFLRACSTQR